MSIFLFEFKIQIKTAVIWTSSIIILLLFFMKGLYPVFEASLDDVLHVINGFPPEFSSAFGFDIKSMFSLGGFYSFAFGYISLLGAIMAVSIGVSTFSREKRSKCVDFLFTKPVSRRKIFISKFLSNISIFIFTNIIYLIACINIFIKDKTDILTVLTAASALFLTQLVFFALGICFAIFAKKIYSVAAISTAFGFASFILSSLVNIFQEKVLRFVAPLKYFDPTALFTNGSFEIEYALAGVALIIIAFGFTFVQFCKSDAHAV